MANATFSEREQDLFLNAFGSEGFVFPASAVALLIIASVLVRNTPPPVDHATAYARFRPSALILMIASWDGWMTPVSGS